MTEQDEFVMTNSELYRHYPVHGYPGWTVQRAGRLHKCGKFYWRLFHNGKIVETTQQPVTLEAARRYAKVWIDDAAKQEASEK